MGVHNLWELLAPVGRRVSVEALGNKKLAIDASIWIVQFMKAMRDDRGDMIRNAHLLGFFRRVCKLLFLRVKPVFVFDGATPALKRKTVIARRRQQENARAKIRKTAEKLLLNHIRTKHLEEASAEASELLGKEKTLAMGIGEESKDEQPTMRCENVFQTATDSSGTEQIARPPSSSGNSASPIELGSGVGTDQPADMHDMEVPLDLIDDDNDDSEELLMLPFVQRHVDPNVLASLPPSMQLDLLVQMREQLVADNRQRFQRVAKAPASFSHLQIEAYLKTVAFRREINEVQQAASGRLVGGVPSTRIASETSREYIFSSAFSGEKQRLEVADSGDQKDLASVNDPHKMPFAYSSSMREKLRSQDYFDTTTGECSTSGTKPVSRMAARIDHELGQDHASRLVLGAQTSSLSIDQIEESQFEKARKGKTVLTGVDERSHRSPVVQSGGPSKLAVSFIDEGGNIKMEDVLFEELVSARPNLGGSQELRVDKDHSREFHMDCDTVVPDSSFQLGGDENVDGYEVEWEDGSVDMLSEHIQPCSTPDLHGNNHENPPESHLDSEATLCDSGFQVSVDANSYSYETPCENGIEGILSGDVMRCSAPDGNSYSPFQQQPDEEYVAGGATTSTSHHPEERFHQLDRSGKAARKRNGNCSHDRTRVGVPYSTETDSHSISSLDQGLCPQQQSAIIPTAPSLTGMALSQHVATALQLLEGSFARLDSRGPTIVPSTDSMMLDENYETHRSLCQQAAGDYSDLFEEAIANPVQNTATSDLEHASGEHTVGTTVQESNADMDHRQLTAEKQEPSGKASLDGKRNNWDIDEDALMVEQLEVALQTVGQRNSVLQSGSGLPNVTSVRDVLSSVVSDHEKHASSTPVHEEEGQPHEEYPGEQANVNSIHASMEALMQERSELREAQHINERNADSVTGEMFLECQELLQMFGLPYIIAPTEAEAQCAYMDLSGLIDGVVTNDSDVFLFGGKNVYKNLFDDRKYVETYHMKDIDSDLGLTREKLIQMALLLGSDYTEGVSGIGIVNAIEVVNAFSGEDGLQLFKDWIESPDASLLKKIPRRKKTGLQKGSVGGADDADKDNGANPGESAPSTGRNYTAAQQLFMEKHRAVSKNWNLPDSFPSSAVLAAYQSPRVDDSQEAFTWGRPDLGALQKICFDAFGWNQSKADELLLPVLKEYDRRETQLRLDSFYSFNQRFAKIRSTRIQKAVSSITGKRPMELMDMPLRESSVAEGCDTDYIGDEVHDQTERQGTRRPRGRKTGRGTRPKKRASTSIGALTAKATTTSTLQPRTFRSSRKSQATISVDAIEEVSSVLEDLESGSAMQIKAWETPLDGPPRAAFEFSDGDVHDEVNLISVHSAPVDTPLHAEPDAGNTNGLIDGVCSIHERTSVAAAPGVRSAADVTQLELMEVPGEQPVTDAGLKPVPSLRRKKRVRI